MFLERLELTGFKSFAQKIILEFPSPKMDNFGITAIVGPNGCGKSNILDAIRWALGEQSLKLLRGKKSEDVIFSGSNKKMRLNLAEVSLHFNNEDKLAPVDYQEFTISRRIYRRGENEYLINKSRVRLQDILILLAQSNFGQKSYSIIGQGMVDVILHSSMTEKKDFFDEATGIKQYQIKRDEAWRKIERSQENLKQAEIALQEIEPRMRLLTRQVKKLEKRQGVEAELKKLQKQYYGQLWKQINRQASILTKKIEENKKGYSRLEKEIQLIQDDLENLLSQKEDGNYQKFQNQYQGLIQLKQKSLEKQAVLKGRLTLEQEKKQPQQQSTVIFSDQPEYFLKKLKEIADDQKKLIQIIEGIKKIEELLGIKNRIKIILKQIDDLINKFQGSKKIESYPSRTVEIEQEIRALTETIQEIDQKIKKTESEFNQSNRAEYEKRRVLYDQQKKMQKKQAELNLALAEENKIRIELAKIEAHRETLEEEIKRELGTIGEELMKSASVPIIIGATADAQSTNKIVDFEQTANKIIDFEQIGKLKHQLELIGGIDPEVIKEYPECRQRYEFLSSQSQDLKETIKSLLKILEQLDEKIKSQFQKNFLQINHQFNEYFRILFGGGQAKLVLKEPKEIEKEEQPASNQENLETNRDLLGIDILATPPGKKIKNVETLSGGEKALTSLALICAIIHNNKPPVVILDEVDASLDEENSGRFAKILKNLANKTQFIIITHNRQTMEASDILYGITMGNEGISRILSLKLEEVDSGKK